MKSTKNEQLIKFKKTEKDLKQNIRSLEKLINKYEKRKKGASKETIVVKARLAISKTNQKISKLSSPEYLLKKTGISIDQKSNLGIIPNIVKLSSNTASRDIVANNQFNTHLMNLSFQLEQDMQRLLEYINMLEKKLSKFLSKREKYQLDSDIYINLLKKSDKYPTTEALSLYTEKGISKSTWARKLKNDKFLYNLIGKLDILINRTKSREKKKNKEKETKNDIDRRSFYIEVRLKLNKLLGEALSKNEYYFNKNKKDKYKSNPESYSKSGKSKEYSYEDSYEERNDDYDSGDERSDIRNYY